MTERFVCPLCGNDTFEQERQVLYDDLYIVKFDLDGEVEDEELDTSDCWGDESVGAYRCQNCGWELVDENGEPVTDPEEIVAILNQPPKANASTDVREAFQDWLDSDSDTVDIGDQEVGLDWFIEKLTGCTDILPAGYCTDLDLPQGSTYGDAVAHLTKEASN